jgi:uncharacterized membrane protein
MDLLRGILLIAATLTTGLMAGVFGLYTHTVMRGLRGTDDRTFVGAFQALDRAIINPWFLVSFLGALVFPFVAGLLSLGADGRPVLPWVAAAFVLYLVVVLVTGRVNVPANDALKAAGDPDRIPDLAGARRAFDEARWVRWNLVRTWASTLGFGLLCWALVRFGEAL